VAESTLTLKRDDLLRAVSNLLGRGVDITAWDDAAFATRVNMCVDIGCRWVYEPEMLPNEVQVHVWSFMQPKLENFTLSQPYSTGTIGIVAGVVTGTGTVFPLWAANGVIVVDGVAYSVATRGGNTSLTLDDTSVNLASGSSYTLQQVDYQLPDLFGGLQGDIYLNQSGSWIGSEVQRCSKEEILAYQKSGIADFSTIPARFAIFPADQTGVADQKWMLTVWPLRDAAYTLSFFYRINPYRLTSNLPYPMGGLPLSECLREAVLAAAEIEFMGQAGIHNQLFRTRLIAAVSADRQMSNPGFLGQNLDFSYERGRAAKSGPRIVHIGLGPTNYSGSN
jgi:hypothetical protein